MAGSSRQHHTESCANGGGLCSCLHALDGRWTDHEWHFYQRESWIPGFLNVEPELYCRNRTCLSLLYHHGSQGYVLYKFQRHVESLHGGLQQQRHRLCHSKRDDHGEYCRGGSVSSAVRSAIGPVGGHGCIAFRRPDAPHALAPPSRCGDIGCNGVMGVIMFLAIMTSCGGGSSSGGGGGGGSNGTPPGNYTVTVNAYTVSNSTGSPDTTTSIPMTVN